MSIPVGHEVCTRDESAAANNGVPRQVWAQRTYTFKGYATMRGREGRGRTVTSSIPYYIRPIPPEPPEPCSPEYLRHHLAWCRSVEADVSLSDAVRSLAARDVAEYERRLNRALSQQD